MLLRILGHGNVFTPVCHSDDRGESLYDVTFSLAAWPIFPLGGLCQDGVSAEGGSLGKGGLFEKGVPVKGGSL